MKILLDALNWVLPPGPKAGPDFRRQVEWLMLLRLLVTSFLLALTLFLNFTDNRHLYFDPAFPLYVLFVAIFILSLIYALALPRIQDLWVFSFFQVMVDVAYTTALIHFTGGASSTFTLLYVFPIIASGVLHFRRGAMITASAASLVFGFLVMLQFYRFLPESAWPWVSRWRNYDAGYVLWVLIVHFTVFFFVATLAGSVAEQLKNTKISLTLREIAFEKLSDLHTNIVESIPSGIATTDHKARVTFVNSPGTWLLGASMENLLKADLASIFPDIQKEESEDSHRRPTRITVKEVRGDQRQIEYIVSDLKESDGEPKGRLVVFQDITEIRRMEERAKLSEKQAAFVRIAAGMAHEIRNPLASLRGASELLSLPVSDPTHQQRLLGIIIRESDRLNTLLNDFIQTVSNRQPKKVTVKLSNLLEELLDLFANDPRLSTGISLKRNIQKGVELEAEQERLKQAVWNLLSNAADASPVGAAIQVSLTTGADEAVLRVQDSGPGIPPEIRGTVFEPFTTTKEFGTGLGLSMVLSIVEAHGGTIDILDCPEPGAVFVIRLPLASSEIFTQV
ncbi:MAG: ATP-binding protein [Desulfomonile sp.]